MIRFLIFLFPVFVYAQIFTPEQDVNVTNPSIPVTQSGSWDIVNISGIISLPTGAATAALQASGNSILSSIDTKLTAPISVTGPLTDTQLRATPVPISATSLPLPTGASTSALQTSGNSILSSIDTKLTAPLSVTGPLTDTQLRATPVPISGTVTANLGTIAGVATETTLSAINTKIPASPSTDRTTAAAPFSTRLSDGTAFYDARTIRALTSADVVTANQGAAPWSFNQTQINGISVATGNGVTGTGVQRVTISSDNTAFTVNSAQSGAWSVTANAGTNLNTSALNLEATQASVLTALQIMDDWDETDRARVNLIVGQAGVQGGSGTISANTQRVVLATDQPNVPIVAPPQSTSTFSPTNDTSAAYTASRVVKASAGTLYGMTCYNSLNQAQFIMVHNTTAVPANGATPVILFRVAASSSMSLDFGFRGRFNSTGITWTNSTTSPTLTIGAANIFCDTQYQ